MPEVSYFSEQGEEVVSAAAWNAIKSSVGERGGRGENAEIGEITVPQSVHGGFELALGLFKLRLTSVCYALFLLDRQFLR